MYSPWAIPNDPRIALSNMDAVFPNKKPPPSLIEAIIKLWGEARDPGWIAGKLNITDANGDPDTERVLCIIEDPTNYGGDNARH